MGRRLPGAPTGHTPAHYGFRVPASSLDALRGLLSRRAAARRDPVELVRETVAEGCLVALETGPALVRRLGAEGLAGACELTVPVHRLDEIRGPAEEAGAAVAVSGPPAVVDEVAPPAVRIVVRADEPDAEERCRRLAGRRVRLVPGGRSRAADLSFVRCLTVLVAADGHPALAVPDARLIAIAGERAAWNGRPSDSWELVMPYGELVHEQRRLVAAGSAVRVDLGALA